MICLSTWVLYIIIAFIIALILVGQPRKRDTLSVSIGPTAVKTGFRRLTGGLKNIFGALEDASRFTAKEFNDELKRQVEPYDQEVAPRTDVYTNTVTGGGDIASKLAATAFATDTRNRIISQRLSEPQVQREPLAKNLFLWTGDHPGRKAIQSNPFVKTTIVNPMQRLGGFPL